MVKVWKVYISGRRWVGGDYNGSWTGFANSHLFSTKEKATKYIKNFKSDWLNQEKVTGPYEHIIE